MRPIIKLPSRPLTGGDTPESLLRLLIESVGAYCAYCESPLGLDAVADLRVSTGDAAWPPPAGSVSVSVPPRRFGAGALAWVNLELCCRACADAKAERPNAADGLTRMQATDAATYGQILAGAPARGRLRLSDDQADDLLRAALDSWVWPDSSSNNDGLVVLLGERTSELLTFERSSASQVELEQAGRVRLTADETEAAWATTPAPGVWVKPDTASLATRGADQADLTARATATIAGLNLNYRNAADPQARDRRVENRTAAAAVAADALAALEATVQRAKGSATAKDEDLQGAEVAALAHFVREAVRATGFWSVWAWTLRSALADAGAAANPVWSPYSSAARSLLLYELLVQYELDRRPPVPRSLPAARPGEPVEDTDPLASGPEEDIVSRMVIDGTDAERLSF